jgi:hypothetical protein
MDGDGRVLPYAEGEARGAVRQSGYAVASLVVSGLSLAWLVMAAVGVALPFDEYKQERIGATGAVLGLVLAMAAYREPNRRRALAHVALALAAGVLAWCSLVVPL